MAATPESKVKKAVKELLIEHGAWFNMPVPAGYGEPLLDFIGCHRGAFFAVECKADGKKLTARQTFTKESMEAAQGKVFVVGEGMMQIKGGGHTIEKYTGMTELEAWLLLH